MPKRQHRSPRFAVGLAGLLAGIAPLAGACVSHTHATDYNGVPGLRGEPVEHQATTSYSLNALWIFSLWGDTSLERVVGQFTREASTRGATRVHVTQTSKTVYWYVFPPISFFIHPVAATVEGMVEGTSTEGG